MNYRRLPKADLNISEIGFGCMALDLKSEGNESLLREAHDLGINYFDTADLYDHGQNEELVGKALKPIREEVIIATKVGNEWLPDGNSWKWNPSKVHILQSVDASLRRLQTDYIDIYQLHGGTADDNREEVIEAFEKLKEQGKIRHYGLSSIRPNVIKPYASETKIVSNMLQYSLLDRRPEEEILDYLKEHQVGVMVRGALAKGLLAGKPPKDYLSYSSDDVQALLDRLYIYIGEHRRPGQVAIQYVLRHKAVTSAVVGMRTREQLITAVNTQNVPDLTDQELQELTRVLKANQYVQHRD